MKHILVPLVLCILCVPFRDEAALNGITYDTTTRTVTTTNLTWSGPQSLTNQANIFAGTLAGTSGSATNLVVSQNLIGNTNAYYALLSYFDVANNPSYRQAWYLCESATPPYTNWFIVHRNPVYVDPNWYTNGDTSGPSVATGGSTIEVGGMLYAVYPNQPNVSTAHPLRGSLNIAASSDMTNWVRIATWTNNDPWTNAWIGSAHWSHVNFGGTNWIVFNYETNQVVVNSKMPVYNYCFGQGEVIPVALTNYTATFGQPVVITANLFENGAMPFSPSTTIITNNVGDFILTCGIDAEDEQYLPYSTNGFFGPYTNTTTWKQPFTHGLSDIVVTSNATTWIAFMGLNGGNYNNMGQAEISTNYGTNWSVLSSSILDQCPALNGLAPQQFDPFQLSTPLTNQSSTAVTGSDATYTGTVKSQAIAAQSVQAATVIANNGIFSGQLAGTIGQPLTVRGNLAIGNGCSNATPAFGNVVMGFFVSDFANTANTVGSFVGGDNYSTADGGPKFEWEDGSDPVNSPLSAYGGIGAYFGVANYIVNSPNMVFTGQNYTVNSPNVVFAGGPITADGGGITNVNFSSLNFSSFVPGPFTNVIVGYIPLWTNNGIVYCLPVGTNQ